MPRPYWKGHIRLSLVSFPVQLYTATANDARVQFHQIDRKTGRRVRYQKIVPEVGPVDSGDIVKGYEIEKDRYVIIEADELASLRLESKHTIDLVQFVNAGEIDPLYYEKPYFIVPDGGMAQEAFRVIRDALRETRKVALGEVVLSGRENIVAIQPCGDGMLLETLRSADELRKGATFFAEIDEGEVDPDQLALARELVARKSAPFDPKRFKDDYEAAVRELIEAKVGHREIRDAAPVAPAGRVVDLMDTLKRSLNADPPAARAKGKRTSAEVHQLPRKPVKTTKAKEPARGQPPSRRRKAS